MLNRTTLELISYTTTQNELNDSIKTKVYNKVFGDQLDVGQAEFYQAQVANMKPVLKFKIRRIEYKNEQLARFPSGVDGTEYKILRTFTPDQEFIELTLEGLSLNG